MAGRIEKENSAREKMEKKLEDLPKIFTLFYKMIKFATPALLPTDAGVAFWHYPAFLVHPPKVW